MNRLDIQHIGINKFLVGLSRADMEKLDITYEKMDYSNIETRRVIWTILDRVRKRTGRDVDPSGNLMIEAAPDSSGGCFLMFTVPASKRNIGTVISKNSGSQIFEFENTDDLLDMLSATGHKSSDFKIYTDGRKYRAEISMETAAPCRRIIEEYGRFIGRDGLTAASTREHWKEISALS